MTSTILNLDSIMIRSKINLKSTPQVVDFLRHAQTDFNIKKDMLSKDISINQFGTQQCIKLEYSKNYDVVICSPMKRCQETLSHIRGITFNKIIYSELCREHKVKNCDFLFEEDETKLETEDQLLERVSKFKGFLTDFQSQSVLVVSHGDFIWYFTSKLVNNGERFGQWLDNCELYQFTFQDS